MKTFRHILLVSISALTLFASANAQQADSTGLHGDDFSLQAALALFKESDSPEDFEKKLNTESNNINNIDLNEDGEVDFIRVEDHMEGDVHAIVLQVPVSEKESQDIAVIEIEKTDDKTVILQIVGDEAIYGEEVIVEPFDEEAKSDGKGGPNADFESAYIVVNVIAWPCVRFVYSPAYVVYRSPIRWRYHPFRWWSPWKRHPWRTFHVHAHHHHHRYRVVKTHRVVHAHRVYTPKRKRSTVVHTRTTNTVKARNANRGVVGSKTTTTTKAVKTPNGVAVGKKTTTTKAAKNSRGATAGKKTTTTKGVVKGKKGKVAGKKTTTKAKKGRNGNTAAKKTTTKKMKRKKGN